jgi:hypothetical protein
MVRLKNFYIKIDGSFFTQLKILLRSTARGLSPLLVPLTFKPKQVADSTLVYTS